MLAASVNFVNLSLAGCEATWPEQVRRFHLRKRRIANQESLVSSTSDEPVMMITYRARSDYTLPFCHLGLQKWWITKVSVTFDTRKRQSNSELSLAMVRATMC